ncbi:MAG TPA: serine/threonine-protein kinase [Bryobacteraceae bacterium]|nr:serine/threonine-protein kinase [Bryobacteraceae bacterium]
MEQIGRYQILGELGRGAMGIVYRAQDPAIGRIVAIKTIRFSDLTDPHERDRLRGRLVKEAQTAGALSHPNIVTIYDVVEEEGTAYVFMECVNGPGLETLMSGPKPPKKDLAISILRQTAGALDYAHSQGIVHRDIKPANIMLHEGLQAKITDFGVAKILSHEMTQSGLMTGTPNYMSPEQAQGHMVDGRADQFALGVVAYELLTGEKPFIGDTLPALLYKIVRDRPIAPQRLNPTLPAEVEPVLLRALAKNPDDRFNSCVEFAKALDAALVSNPKWAPLPRGAVHAMPTVVAMETKEIPEPVSRPEQEPPLIKSLAWALLGIGLVGVVLIGLQRFVDSRARAESAQAQSPVQTQTPAQTQTTRAPAGPMIPIPSPPKPAPTVKPKPSPVNRSQAEVPAPRAVEQPHEHESKSPPPSRDASVQAPAPAGPVRTVQFVTDPAGASVILDSGKTCSSPCMVDLAPGRHTLSAKLAGYRDYQKVFNVPQDSDIFLSLAPARATLSITSNPPGATVQLNGTEQGRRTPLLVNIAPGTYHVRVSHNGVPSDFDVTLTDGEFVTRNVKF